MTIVDDAPVIGIDAGGTEIKAGLLSGAKILKSVGISQNAKTVLSMLLLKFYWQPKRCAMITQKQKLSA